MTKWTLLLTSSLSLPLPPLLLSRLQVFLNTYGIQTQTPQQVEPIQIWPQKELVKVTQLSICSKSLYKMAGGQQPVPAGVHWWKAP